MTRTLVDSSAVYAASIPEADIQAVIVQGLRLLGYTVLITGAGRKRIACPSCRHVFFPTGWQGNTPGLPDLYVCRHGNDWIALEVKRPGGAIRGAQRALADAGHSTIVHSWDEALAAVQEVR